MRAFYTTPFTFSSTNAFNLLYLFPFFPFMQIDLYLIIYTIEYKMSNNKEFPRILSNI